MGVGSIVLLSKSVYRQRLCSQLAILMVSSTSTPLQILILINGNNRIAQFVKDSESGVHPSLFKGSPVKTAEHV